MDPKTWGPNAWTYLHAVSFNYPEAPTREDIATHSDFVTMFGRVLPCGDCRNHFAEILSTMPVVNSLGSRRLFMNWVIDVHNAVNQRLGYPIKTYEQIYSKYTTCASGTCGQIRYTKSTSKTRTSHVAAGSLFAVTCLLILYARRRRL